MRRQTKTFAVVAALAAVGYITYIATYPTISLRYRLALNMVVDGVTRTGSGVVEIVYNFEPHPFNIDDILFYPAICMGMQSLSIWAPEVFCSSSIPSRRSVTLKQESFFT